MRRTRISILCAAVLAAVPAGAEAGGLGSVVGAVASAPGAILGGLFGGGKARHSRHHARRPASEQARRAPTQRAIARAAPAIAVETKPADRPGTAFWPAAYNDAFAYVLTPARYDGAFWGRGYADVVDAMFVPSAAAAGAPGKQPARPGRSVDSDKAGDFVAASACADAENAGALVEQIEHTVHPGEAQRPALDELGSALRGAAERVQVACSTELSGGPGARLETMWRRLRALRQAVILVRAPLGNFYASLNEDQKARLDTLAQEGAGLRTSAREARPDPSLRACEGARMPEWPVASIAQAIQLSEDQRPMLELLMGTSLHYAHQLRASCAAAPTPLTPTARLEAVDERLTAMVYAVTVLRGTLNKFYGILTEEQRGRFDAMSSTMRPTERHRAELR